VNAPHLTKQNVGKLEEKAAQATKDAENDQQQMAVVDSLPVTDLLPSTN